MPVQDIVILALIVSLFAMFGGLLGWATWYCSEKRKHGIRHDDRWQGHYPSNPNLLSDDD
jgi:hypothetical protein